ncbi:spermidine synthase [Sanguibacter sp. Leaf3]|uniref:spermidine synthase n=1 Tax=Sanguibacter sp. Leaf3 TaxID=1736209 RepID=UPI0006FCA1F6|nr:fused MFS/spermidine synthase [Sanguibacter sp. Leaf3]KQU00534.1 spermidine synthase [Sanguibacter sp. Leaf3]
MARRTSRRSSSSGPLTQTGQPDLPAGPVETSSGTVELVLDRDDHRSITVMLNGVPSSFIDLDDPTNVGFEYMEIMSAVLDDRTEGPLDVVHLGAAGCAMARSVDARRPGSRQIGIDIDARLLELARSWFDLPRSPRLRLRAGDAREQLATLATSSVDVVVRDVFAGDSTPGHLLTVEFVVDVLRVLRPGGLYLVNCADKPPLSTARAEVATIRAALDSVATDSVPRTDDDLALITEPAVLKARRYGNIVLAATAPGGPRDGDGLASAGLARALRSLAVPAHILCGPDEVSRFAGTAVPLIDPAPPA